MPKLQTDFDEEEDVILRKYKAIWNISKDKVNRRIVREYGVLKDE